ncbi:MAG: Cytosine-specific methyltransferase [Candidatus Brocadiaceae bacterium]|nr:Cytosine-specific methyltransferase [Candidatus Brocadiaceae bacterium]
MNTANYVSLFSGAGGLDIGLERAGFRSVSLCEIESVFCDTLKVNQRGIHDDGHEYFKEAKIFNADIRDISGADLANGKQIDLVVGGPPCQAFSSAGKQLSVLDPRGLLVNEYFRVIDEIQPRMFLFENVRGLVTARDSGGDPGGVIKELLKRFWEAGYSCRAELLNSADYGSFQRRVRCFIIGAKHGKSPLFPAPTHQKQGGLFYATWKSLGAFLENHADQNREAFTLPTETLALQLHGLPNGAGLKSKGKAEKTRPGRYWGYRQGTFIADLSLPARTITGSACQDWIRWDGLLRRLTLNEVKLLQGFPSDWEICGTKAQKYKQIGNAVPTLFGELIGEVILKFLCEYPDSSPAFIEMPHTFRGYIDYTKKDHARNADSRTVHRRFGKG